jgi:hypothetical protein
MRETIGYYDKDGEYLGKKYPGSKRIFYLAFCLIKKKISEIQDVSPYENGLLNRYSFRFNDKKRLLVYIDKYNRGRLVKHITANTMSFRDPEYNARYKITHDASEKIKKYYSRKLSISKDDVKYEC